MAVTLPASELPASRRVLDLERVCFGYEPDRPVVKDISISIVGPERVAITGVNASGKSTLLALAAGLLKPWSGQVEVHVPFAFFDQRVSLLDPRSSIADNYRRLNPGADNNSCRAVLARFLFKAAAADRPAGALSGGELLRAGLACVLGGRKPPSLLILDEPTNHLDVDSIEAVEAALCSYDGALLVVSHDEAFLEAIAIDRRLAITRARLIPASRRTGLR
jgi:ATPase subunit of ABC transporter with duplicated ATPase domains